jgi:heme/copper-type cytochrome/quinol oxidase subunit 2
MEVLAVTSGSAIAGATIMGMFVLGTTPLFAAVGVATAKLSDAFQQRFTKIAAWLLILLGVMGLNGVLTVLDSPMTLQKITHPVTYFFSDERLEDLKRRQFDTPVVVQDGVQKVLIIARNEGYSPQKVRVKAGVPVQLTVQTKDSYTCASYFYLKAFNIKMQLGPNDSQTATFTPTQPGSYQYTCAMGMYTGTLEVQ